MGNEALCRVELDGVSSEAKVVLESEELIVRSPFRIKAAFRDIREIEEVGDVLRLRWASHELHLHLGAQASKWAVKIRKPRTVFEKLGLRAGQRVSVLGAVEDGFVTDLIQRGLDVSPRLRRQSDVVFYAADERQALERLGELREALTAAGALWVIRPRGVPEIRESDVMAAGKRAGLVDVKVVRFSPTHTAEKFVIPVTNRRNRG